ncbi:MAG: DUF2330 domain-containing protein [Polyangiales bacterium]
MGAFTASLWGPSSAEAFCGFYVGGSEVELGNDSSFVVLLRDGTKTVMTMRNDYVGPAADFALVVPVPVSISEDDVHVLNPEVLESVERFTSPRLVEYWENAPRCPSRIRPRGVRVPSIRSSSASIRVETSFAVGEYDFAVLGAGDSLSLERYLTQNGYRIPSNAAALLRPYVLQGYRFLVAKVDASRVTFANGRAELSPIRIAYDSPRFALPIRLGLANSRGEQDIVAVVISREGRFEVANRRNVFVPTNLEVRPEARERFSELYASILDRTFERNPGAAVTEHAWAVTGCDPCTGPTLGAEELDQLGGDVISGAEERATLTHEVKFLIERRSGDGHSAAAVSDFLDRRRVPIAQCAPHARGGWTEAHADISFGSNGSLTRLRVPRSTAGYGACLARIMRHSRLMPSARGDSSDWRVRIHFQPVYQRSQASAFGFTATRLHLRVRPGGDTSDLVFRHARAVAGGVGSPNARGALPSRRASRERSTFQARYAILHRWERPMTCEGAIHTGWGGSRRRHLMPHAETFETQATSTDIITDLVVGAPSELRPRRFTRAWQLREAGVWNGDGLPPAEPARERTRAALRATRRSCHA